MFLERLVQDPGIVREGQKNINSVFDSMSSAVTAKQGVLIKWRLAGLPAEGTFGLLGMPGIRCIVPLHLRTTHKPKVTNISGALPQFRGHSKL